MCRQCCRLRGLAASFRPMSSLVSETLRCYVEPGFSWPRMLACVASSWEGSGTRAGVERHPHTFRGTQTRENASQVKFKYKFKFKSRLDLTVATPRHTAARTQRPHALHCTGTVHCPGLLSDLMYCIGSLELLHVQLVTSDSSGGGVACVTQKRRTGTALRPLSSRRPRRSPSLHVAVLHFIRAQPSSCTQSKQ